MSTTPITEKELLKREKITVPEIKYLVKKFDLNKLDLANACDVTYNTFGTYYIETDPDAMPQVCQRKLITYFLKQFAGSGEPEVEGDEQTVTEERFKKDLDKVITTNKEDLKKQPLEEEPTEEGKRPGYIQLDPDGVREIREELKKQQETINQQPDSYPHIDKKFKHLSFSGIYFNLKGQLCDALQEAAEYSLKSGVPVYIIHNGRNFKIECVE